MKIVFSLIFLLLVPPAWGGSLEFYKIPPMPPPHKYGNILISRNSETHNIKSVAFPHWSHRMKYTCRVCHSELEFELVTNSTEITEEANRAGKFCGACHNGKDAFGHTKENCERCHSDDLSVGKEQFQALKQDPDFKTVQRPFGNGINWVAAMKQGLIKPKSTILGNHQQMPFDKKLILKLEWGMLPPAVFPHKEHVAWLDCSSCHPDVFNIKKRTTKHFSMERMLKAEFCGLCHLRTAFPMDDCKRCHPS